VYLGLRNELEHVGRAGCVREKNWMLPTSGERWPAPPPRRSCPARRGLHRLDRRPTSPGTGLAKARGRGTAAEEGARAPAARRGHSKGKEESKSSSHPPTKSQGVVAARERRQAAHGTPPRARAQASAGGASAADRQGRRRRSSGGEGSGRVERAWHPKRRATRQRARHGRCTATARPPAGRGPCRRRGDRQEIFTRPVTGGISIRVRTSAFRRITLYHPQIK